MENDPSKIKIIIETGGVNYELTPDNTVGSIHQEENETYDYILHVTDAGDPFIFFRESMSNFDDVIEFMLHNKYMVNLENDVKDLTKDFYLRTYGRDPSHKTHLTERELTPRQEKLVDFLAYILEKDHLLPDDFKGDGDLRI